MSASAVPVQNYAAPSLFGNGIGLQLPKTSLPQASTIPDLVGHAGHVPQAEPLAVTNSLPGLDPNYPFVFTFEPEQPSTAETADTEQKAEENAEGNEGKGDEVCPKTRDATLTKKKQNAGWAWC